MNRGRRLKVLNGIDLLLDDSEEFIKNRPFALITGSSMVDGAGTPLYLSLKESQAEFFKAIWSLQHGFFVDKQDNMILSESFTWDRMKLEVRSLYGDRLVPGRDWLESVELIVIDVFDTGTRVYTFLNHLLKILASISGKGIDVLVLDRINPLNGLVLEGNCAGPAYFSIVSQIDIPMRHGLTCAEFLQYGINYHKLDINLEILPVRGWSRRDYFSGIWTYPSPNMPSFNTGLVYPGAVMLEGTNLSEGRGTTRPFEMLGAPFIDNVEVCRILNQTDLPGAVFIPVYFKPEFSKYKDEICHGVLVHVNNRSLFRSVGAYYEIIRCIRNRYPAEFAWNSDPYEFETRRPAIDMICGSDLIRHSIERDLPYRELESQIGEQLEHYGERRIPFLLY
jgi:uncharacterized protein YbbC (DUF1343 family)